jgi:hypothetical protein
MTCRRTTIGAFLSSRPAKIIRPQVFPIAGDYMASVDLRNFADLYPGRPPLTSSPEITPHLRVFRDKGCRIQTGVGISADFFAASITDRAWPT